MKSHSLILVILILLTGDYMKDKYDGATEVRVNKRGRLQVKNAQYNLPTANDLVYLDESPDYCIKNKTIGSFGNDASDFEGLM